MVSSVFRVNQACYAAGLPVRAAVLKEGPVILENENGEAEERHGDKRGADPFVFRDLVHSLSPSDAEAGARRFFTVT